MTLTLINEVGGLAFITACLYFVISMYVHRKRPEWSALLEKRRLGVLALLVLAIIAIKVSEDVATGASSPIDKRVLQFIHDHVPPSLHEVFEVVTITGSGYVLVPLSAAVVLAFLFAKRRFEALLLAASVISGAMVVYVLKGIVGRARPALWKTEWYWGSSFPSGHTLVVAAFALATAIGVSRIWPERRNLAMFIATIWVLAVAGSRLVLGVHWPTDVVAAACIGAFLPLAVYALLDLRHA